MQKSFITAAIILAMLSSSVPLASVANAQSAQTVTPYYPNDNSKLPTQNQILQSTLSGPVFLNAYWTDQSASSSSPSGSSTSGSSSSSSSASSSAITRKQVGPGDGAATLAVVLLDRGLSDITGVTGHLTLPSGFTPNGARSGANIADASYNSLVTAGNTFTLYFDINVTDRTYVGAYVANLDVQYSQVLSTGNDIHNQLNVPFQLTGRVILDTLTITHNLTPGVANDVQFQLVNRGTAPATGAVVSITGISTSGASNSGSGVTVSTSGSDVRVTNFGARTFNVGTIASNSSTTLTASLFPGNNAGSSTTTVSLQITYNDPYGNTQTLSPTISLFVLPSSPSLISVLGGTNGNASDNRVVAGKVANFALLVSNRGTSPVTNAVVTLDSGSSSLQILGDTKWTVNSIDGQSSVQLPTTIYASPSLIGTPVNFSVTIDYLTNGQSKTEQYTIGTYVDGDINLSTYGLALTFVGGGNAANTNSGAATSFGGTPTLTGNILNKGNTVALFTTVQLEQIQYLNGSNVGRFRQAGGQGSGSNQGGFQGQFGGAQGGQFGQGQQGAAAANSNQTFGGRAGLRGSLAAQPQYLGDVTADSPVPFSITLDSLRNATATPLRVTLLITYSDGLRNPHEMTVSQVVAPQSAGLGNFGNRNTGPFAFLGPLSPYGIPIIIAIIAAIVAAVVIVIVRKRRAKARRAASRGLGAQDNIEDILEEPTTEKGSQSRSKDGRLK